MDGESSMKEKLLWVILLGIFFIALNWTPLSPAWWNTRSINVTNQNQQQIVNFINQKHPKVLPISK